VSGTPKDPRCPECGGKIGQTATYCMHCSADLTEERNAHDADNDGVWDQAEIGQPSPQPTATSDSASRWPDVRERTDFEALLAPDGLVDDSLTVVVGIAGGLFVGTIGTFVLAMVTRSGWALAAGLVVWLVATAVLVRQRTVQGAIAYTGYGLAAVLLLVPFVALSPAVSVEGGIGERGGLFVALLVFVAVPAVVAAGLGWVAAQFRPGS
jgi:hypothetical protein